VRLGVNLVNFGPAASPEALARQAEDAEALGYHFVMISDHVAITPDVAARYPAPFYDPFTTLAWVAARTRRVELGTTVIVLPYRHPLETARMAATVDRLSGGRLILGVGAGWAREEFEALGVPFHRRGAMTDDYLAALARCFAEDVATHRGPFASFAAVATGPRPARAPRPPIWVGGATDAALARAVRFGDAWHPIRVRVDWLAETGLPRLAAIAAAEGRRAPALCPRIRLNTTDAPWPEAERLAGQGTLEQVRADLEGLARLGAEYVLLDPYADAPAVDLAATRRALVALAERVVDLERQALR